MLIGYGDFVFCFLDKRDDLLCSFLQDPAFIGQLDCKAFAAPEMLSSLATAKK